MNNISEYERRKQALENNVQTLRTRLQNAQTRYNDAEKEYEIIKNDNSADFKQKRQAELKLEIEKRKLLKANYVLQRLLNKLSFLRPENENDKSYRLRQYREFSRLVDEHVPEDLHLCFHGCPIDAAMHILEDGEISSSVDRIGSETSYDVSDQVSVSTKDNVRITVEGYSGLLEMEYPAGCIFAIIPKDEDEIKSSRLLLIGNVNFRDNPERLHSIITTPENIERVTEWAKKSGVDPSKIHDYDEFIKIFEKEKNEDISQSTLDERD